MNHFFKEVIIRIISSIMLACLVNGLLVWRFEDLFVSKILVIIGGTWCLLMAMANGRHWLKKVLRL